MWIFHEVRHVPAHSVLLLPTREEALHYPKGNITLGLCHTCGFIGNTSFDPRLNQYDGEYEATQGFSFRFNHFHRRLAEHLIDRFHLREKTVVEIGSGQGEFLHLLSEMGNCKGVGFDPAFSTRRGGQTDNPHVQIIKDFYSERYTSVHGDLFCCKMTLEHIPDVRTFLMLVRRSIGNRRNTPVFFQVPNASYVLAEGAFWDIYYEHCSYFTPGSLTRLFQSCDFNVTDLWTDYNDQYTMIVAYPGAGVQPEHLAAAETISDVVRLTEQFVATYPGRLQPWQALIEQIRRDRLRAVIWGGGSKGVTFLNTLGIIDEITCAVDINPHKQGTFIAGSGQEIVAPDFLRTYRPDLVIVMNPIYQEEIGRELAQMGVSAQLVTV
jgi:SAM-dependent methyltransferase